MSKKKVLLRGVFINRDTNGEGVLKVGTTLIRVSTVMGILYDLRYPDMRYKQMYEKKRIKQICEITPNICKVFWLKNKKSLKRIHLQRYGIKIAFDNSV